jgi:hypothetical protein
VARSREKDRSLGLPGLRAAILDELVEDFAIRCGQIVASEIRNPRSHQQLSSIIATPWIGSAPELPWRVLAAMAQHVVVTTIVAGKHRRMRLRGSHAHRRSEPCVSREDAATALTEGATVASASMASVCVARTVYCEKGRQPWRPRATAVRIAAN